MGSEAVGYWGGAMFCLLADVEMRKRSDNKLGLQDAMLAAGGTHDKDWAIERILSVADTAVGMTVKGWARPLTRRISSKFGLTWA